MSKQDAHKIAGKGRIYSVSELNLRLKQIISENFPLLWVEGEISNLARPASGHIYFSIKDKNAQIRCVMFRSSKQRIAFQIRNGLQVIARTKAGLYEPRGDLQLIVDDLEEAGFGALQRQFEALKNKLHRQGLFDAQYKQALPAFPATIGIITSPSGAAIKDFLQVARRRYPASKKIIYSVPVQGENAARSIQQALEAANRQARADVLAVIRGGGSIEDLWAFNDEALARAIVASSIPVITGIGHEIDYTIADFAADLRAATPSVAAELSCPDHAGLMAYLSGAEHRLKKQSLELIHNRYQRIDWLGQRLDRSHPKNMLDMRAKALARLKKRLQNTSQRHIRKSRDDLDGLLKRFKNQSPQKRLAAGGAQVDAYAARLCSAVTVCLAQCRHRFELRAATLQAVSPLNTLRRGYSITLTGDSSALLADHNQVSQGDQLTTYLSRGKVFSRVESTSSKSLSASLLSATKSSD